MKKKLLVKSICFFTKRIFSTKTLSILLFFTLLCGTKIQAQDPNLIWVKQMGGANSDYCTSTVVDASGNVYTTGYFEGTADFDPNVGVTNLTSTSSYGYDVFISKLDAMGNLVWAKATGGANSDYGTGYSISVDVTGNVYTTGHFAGTTDFDPNAGVSNLTSAGSSDIFVSKLDADGNLVWAKSMGGADTDYGFSISVDASGNVYTTGYFQGTVDFDPNGGVANLISVGSYEIFVSKLNAEGNLVWAKSMGGDSYDVSRSIAVDVSGNIYTTGYFEGTADFDPNSGVANLTSAGNRDIYVSKLDALGNFVWAKAMGNIYGDIGNDISVDAFGNVYTIGYFAGTVDFDPNAGVSNLTSAGSNDIFVSKLDSAGNLVWAKSMGGTNADYGFSICVDLAGNVYTMGYFYATADFDPNVGVSNLTSAGNQDVFILKLDATGNLVWAKTIGGTSADYGFSISVDVAGNIYTTGNFQGTADFDPNAGVVNLTSLGSNDIFVHKMSDPSLGNNDFEAVRSFKIYPNPSNGMVNIESVEQGSYQIYNQLGQLVKIFIVETNGINTVTVENLANGFYFIKESKSGIVQKLLIRK